MKMLGILWCSPFILAWLWDISHGDFIFHVVSFLCGCDISFNCSLIHFFVITSSGILLIILGIKLSGGNRKAWSWSIYLLSSILVLALGGNIITILSGFTMVTPSYSRELFTLNLLFLLIFSIINLILLYIDRKNFWKIAF
jgi:hypothetical protein